MINQNNNEQLRYQVGYKNVLIADRKSTFRKTIKKALVEDGFNCFEYDEPDRAVSGIGMLRPELLIVGQSSVLAQANQIVQEVSNLYPQTSIILATSATDLRAAQDYLESGAQDFIMASSSPDEVTKSARRALKKTELEQKIERYSQRLETVEDIRRNQLRNIFLSSVEGLVYELESGDRYTSGHSRRVTRYAMAMGRDMSLTKDEMEDLWWASLLHDVGKIALDPATQNKPGRLSDEEYRYVMSHATLGVKIISPLINAASAGIIAHHHDHFDGTGLDQTVSHDGIPLGARLLALADSFDAMTSERPFRAARSIEQSIVEVMRCAGTQFDPAAVKSFLKTVGSFPEPKN